MKMPKLVPFTLLALLLAFQGSRANAQTFTYVNGEDNTTAIDLTPPVSTFTIDSGTATQSGAISGGGSLHKAGNGTLIFSGASPFSAALTLDAGTLQIGTGGALQNVLVINVLSGTTLQFSGGTIDSVAGISNYGTVNFTRPSQIIGGIGGPGSVNLGSGQLLIVEAADFEGVVSGVGGSLVLNPSTTAELKAANTYTGGTTLQGGVLFVDNAQALGTGGLTQTGGTLETDNINHSITIESNFVQTDGVLQLNINGAPDTDNYDRVNIMGTAILNGNLVINYTPGAITLNKPETFTVITTTGGITSVNSAGYEPPTLDAGALHISITGAVDGNNFDVTLLASQTAFTSLSGTNFTPNQQSVAAYLDRFDGKVSSGPIISLLQALDDISVNPAALGPYLNQLTTLNFGQFTSNTAFNNTSFATQQLDTYLAGHRGANGTFVSSAGGLDSSGLMVNDPNIDSGLQMVHSRLLAWNPAPHTGLLSDIPNPLLGGIDMNNSKTMLSSETVNSWNAFIAGNVVLAHGSSDPTAGLAHTDATTGAVQVGADYRITPNFLIGGMFGYGHTHATLDSLGSNATVDTYSPAVYASYSSGGWYANALSSYGFANYDQNRNVAIGAFTGTAHSSPGGDQIVGNLDGGYDFHCSHWTVGPTAGMQYVHLNVDGFSEIGLPGADLSVNQNESDSLRSRLGGRVSYAVQDGEMTFTPHLSASWQHEFLDQSRGITSQFDGVGAGSFVVNTPNPSRDSALVDVGLDAEIDKTLTVFADYTVQAGQSNYFGQSVQAGVKIGF